MDLQQKALEAIKKAEKTERVTITDWHLSASMTEGISVVDVTAQVVRRRVSTMSYQLVWDEERQEFIELTGMYISHYCRFNRELTDIKRSQRYTKAELFSLLRKANRRRKSAERKVYKLRGKARRISDDAMTAIGSRHRMIEEQWEVMRELQRRGLVSTENLEKVIFDVTGMRRVKFGDEP